MDTTKMNPKMNPVIIKLIYKVLEIEKMDFHIKCPDCEGVFQRLIRFVDYRVAKPPPIKMDLIEEPDGWKYWLDHIRGYS